MNLKALSLIPLIAGGTYLASIAPNKNRKERMKPYMNRYIAHRGLFDNEHGIPENSTAAFARAIVAGYGIELDVQMTTDHKLVVFHDESLKRMCGIDKRLVDCSYAELCRYRLAGTEERIPLFRDVLSLVSGSVPLIVEIKSEGDWLGTTQRVAHMLDRYEGIYCMESFHPMAVAWFRKHRPHVIRGQLSTDYFKDKVDQPWIENFILTNLMMNGLAKPDFIAYNHKHKSNLSFTICRNLFPVTNVAWTIKNQDDLDAAKDVFDVIIFDSFVPEKKD